MNFSIATYEVVQTGEKTSSYTCTMLSSELAFTDQERDLGVIVGTSLKHQISGEMNNWVHERVRKRWGGTYYPFP